MMSATLIRNSVADAAKLSEYTLGVRSPLPHAGHQLEVWQHVLDPRDAASADERAWFEERVVRRMGVDPNEYTKIEAARVAAGRRFVQSNGIVFTPAASTDVPLTINRIEVPLPESVDSLLRKVQTENVSPDGEYLTTDMHISTCVRSVSCGFYNRWAWEKVPGGRDQDWLDRRGAWRRALAGELRNNAKTNYDSEKLVSDYVLAECVLTPELVDKTILHNSRWRWAQVEDRPEPPSVPVWVDTFLIDEVLRRYQNEKVIIWYSHQAIEQELTRRGVTCYGEGTFLEGPERLVGASIRVHGTGRNLQDWNKSVVLELPSDGLAWEQLLGRLHRQGQTRPVQFDVITCHPVMAKALTTAIENAKFIQSMQMTPQRLLTATWTHGG